MKLVTQLFCVAAFTLVAGCTVTTNKSSVQLVALPQPVAVPTTQQYGGVVVTTNNAGQWTEISSTEAILVGLDGGKDLQRVAMRQALEYAKQNIVTFVNSNVGFRTINPTYNYDRRMNEAVYDYSSAVVRGIKVTKMVIEGDRAVVQISVRRADVLGL